MADRGQGVRAETETGRGAHPDSTDQEPRANTAGSGQSPEQVTQKATNITNVNVQGSMLTPRKAFEGGAAGSSARPRRKAIGKLDASDVDVALRSYVTPSTYDIALRSLLTDHVLILEGEAGCGRSAGAIALLREVTDRTLVVLSPVITLNQLADRDYDSNFGYVVIDHANHEAAADTDHTWRRIRDKVRETGTYLVLTTVSGTASPHIEAVRGVPWPKPPLR